ncbi:InlB B-repeat-containing protein [Synergistaceae bacterium OttesenSCG-928-I11]|nr:InlB B-repeat-containing protein [Synergistaceae bacterium OttesenSCG-928-I11]
MTPRSPFRPPGPHKTSGRWRRAAIVLLPLLLSLLLCAVSAEAHVVSFDSTGGSEVAPYTDVQENATIAVPTAPWRNGATFLGWFRDPELTTAWNFEIDRVTGDLTLYAGWQNTYLVRVENGYTNTSRAVPGERVHIRAYSAGYWERFDRWVSLAGDVHFADRYDSSTSFIMPARNVTVGARYRDRWDDDIIGSIGGGCNAGASGGIALFALALLVRPRRQG